MLKKDVKGFTLVELLVVIAIIAILAAVIVPNAFRAVEKSKVSAAIQDLETFKTSALMFYADTGVFPLDVEPDADPGFYEKKISGWPGYTNDQLAVMGFSKNDYIKLMNKKWQGPYIERPFNKQNPWGGTYDYEFWISKKPEPANRPAGVWVTIRSIPESAAELLVEKSPFEVAQGKAYQEEGNELYAVSLKIAEYPYEFKK